MLILFLHRSKEDFSPLLIETLNVFGVTGGEPAFELVSRPSLAFEIIEALRRRHEFHQKRLRFRILDEEETKIGDEHMM